MYGGEGQKGARVDPRASRVRREAMSGGGGPSARTFWLWIGGGAVVAGIVVVLVVVLSGGGDGAATTVGEPDPDALYGRLDCTPGVVVTETIPGEGRGPREIMQAVEPGVSMVSQDPVTTGKWWGYDVSEHVVAALKETTIAGEYTAYTCSE